MEIFSDNCLGFHNTPNTILHELVTILQDLEVVEGVSSGIASVIRCDSKWGVKISHTS